MIVADSLRYDSVYQHEGIGASYLDSQSIQFTNASSPACWTLPATASLFTGALPHEHKATTQSRYLSKNVPTLAEILKAQGYNTFQITSNIATTDIFGLDRGFDKVYKTWEIANENGMSIKNLLLLLGKPRIRNKLFSKDVIAKSLSKDMKAAGVWFNSHYKHVFEKATAILEEHDKKNQKAFLFLNLMETHFPYHIGHDFKFLSPGFIDKVKELKSMYNIVNQTFLTKDGALPENSMLKTIKSRQHESWKLIRKDLDEFARMHHEDKDNLVIFTSDHGENFGDQNWVYHFSNVSDACTRVPIFWLDPNGMTPSVKDHKVSSRSLFHSIAKRSGYEDLNGEDLFTANVHNIPISQSYWYNNHGKTLDKYKFNQFCFHVNDKRYLKKNGSWFQAETTKYGKTTEEPLFEQLDADVNPLQENVIDPESRTFIQKQLDNFLAFEKTLN